MRECQPGLDSLSRGLPKFDRETTRAFLSGLNPREVVAVDE